jgi:hypothetical protein
MTTRPMNPFSPELAPFMLASSSSAPVVNVGVLAFACVIGVIACGRMQSRAYALVCSGATLWTVARDFSIPLDALLVAALPQFAMPPAQTTGGLAVGLAGLLQYVLYSMPAPDLAQTQVAFIGVLAFLYVQAATDGISATSRAFMVGLWYVYPRVAHLASGALLVSAHRAGAAPVWPVMAALGATLAVAALGDFAAPVLALTGLACLCFSI